MELNSKEYDESLRQGRASSFQMLIPLSRAVLKRKGDGKE